MTTPTSDDLPPDLPRSPTGRVPQWVFEEAAGQPTAPVPFRAWPEAPRHARRRRTGRRVWLTLLAAVAVVALVLGGTRLAANLRAPTASPAPGSTSTVPTSAGGSSTPASPTPSGSVPRSDADGPVLGFEETPRPSSLPMANLRQNSALGYLFTARQPDRVTGVTWSPCRPIHYVLRGSGTAPRDGARMLRESLATLAALTGLTFVSDGTTTEKYSDAREAYQPQRYGQRWAPVLLSWSTTREDPGLKGDVLGRAGAQWVTTESGDRAYVSGTVSLDAREIGLLRSEFGYAVARSVVLHELGHLVGLAHVKDRTSLMYPEVNPRVRSFSARDRAGLAALGEGPCQPDV